VESGEELCASWPTGVCFGFGRGSPQLRRTLRRTVRWARGQERVENAVERHEKDSHLSFLVLAVARGLLLCVDLRGARIG
jgi:hypothetical protein